MTELYGALMDVALGRSVLVTPIEVIVRSNFAIEVSTAAVGPLVQWRPTTCVSSSGSEVLLVVGQEASYMTTVRDPYHAYSKNT